ncbi:hypothetical protein ADILRU_1029 [Leifsonia rubra CMS 76R]|nr:hypothetical protein ADILRU_1029 [Leifsonia rubra CMS 76R]
MLAEYPDELSFKKWALLRLEAHIATKMAALLDRHFSEKGQKDARKILVTRTIIPLSKIDQKLIASTKRRGWARVDCGYF